MPKIFGIGMFKTGTTSLKVAFQKLGYKTNGAYWRLVPELQPLFDLSGKAFDPHYKAIYQKALKSQAFFDSPWLYNYRILEQWFPGSKFILTLRDADTVAKSDMNMWRGGLDEIWFKQTGELPTLRMLKRRYIEHNERVRRYFSGRDLLLEFCIETDVTPWKTLCQFLGIEKVLTILFPHVNKCVYE